MELRDFLVTPSFVIIIYFIAYFVKGRVTDSTSARYYFPALTLKIIGAIAVGLIYQFYYNGGDTFAYHTHGSRVVWEAFLNKPNDGIKLLFSRVTEDASLYKYAESIWFFWDPQSYFVVRVATFFDFITFSTYSSTAVLFALLAFSGGWALFTTFYKLFPDFHRWIAFSCLFIPSVFFWGSGIFKDTITLSAVGWLTYSFSGIAFEKKNYARNIILFILAAWIVFSIKKYILLTFLPAMVLWFFASKIGYVKSLAGKVVLFPVVVIAIVSLGLLIMKKVGENDERYELSKIAMTAKITAYDIRYGWGARAGEGSGYTLGELDGTWQSMIPLIPKGINVTLFRPYLWEVRNPLMVLSALESLGLLVITIYLLLMVGSNIIKVISRPEILFCLTFSIVFAFAVGISTYNFGTLSRYKIPMMPYYLLALGLIYYHHKKNQKEKALKEELGE